MMFCLSAACFEVPIAKWKSFLVILLCFGILTLFFYQTSILNDMKANGKSLDHTSETSTVTKVCKSIAYSSGFAENGNTLRNLIVNDDHKVIYCYIPKVACTHWKKVMYVLKTRKSAPYPDLMSISSHLVHKPGLFTFLEHPHSNKTKEKIQKYTKFMFVRHPFVRLVSAFRNKFRYKKANKFFYQKYGRTMLRLYGNQSDPPKTMYLANKRGKLPTFSNFVKFLTDRRLKRWRFNDHWKQMYQLCQPCHINYDFIGHQENLDVDARKLLKLLKLEEISFPHSYDNVTTYNSMKTWFKDISLTDRRKLYQIYEKDFEIFGYKKPSELLE